MTYLPEAWKYYKEMTRSIWADQRWFGACSDYSCGEQRRTSNSSPKYTHGLENCPTVEFWATRAKRLRVSLSLTQPKEEEAATAAILPPEKNSHPPSPVEATVYAFWACGLGRSSIP